MSEQITTAGELDALPVESVVRCDDLEGIGLNVCERHEEGWQYVGSSLHFSSIQVASDGVVFTVLYRPDAPERTEPTEDQVLTILRTHGIECTGLGEVTCVGCRSAGWMTWGEYRLHLARAVLDLLPQRVAPSEEEIAKAIDDHVNSREFGIVRIYDAECAGAAHDVAALYASQPTVAEVRAQALRDFANEMSPVYAIEGSAAWHARAVADRAERGEA